MNDWKGRRVLITGANRGIGEVFARAAARAGAHVYAHGRTLDRLAALRKEIDLVPIEAELSDPAAAGRIREQLGDNPLDALINNAAFEIKAPLAEFPNDQLEAIIRVDLLFPMELSRALLPNLQIGRNPCIVHVTSIHDTVPARGNSPYAIAKAGLLMHARSAAIEFAPLGVRVNALAPGAIETDMNREAIQTIGPENFKRWIPAGRIGRAEELVDAFLFLAGPASTYTTGARLCVDGGYEHHLLRYPMEDRVR